MNFTLMVYTALTILCAGIIVYAVIQLAFIYLRIPRRETLPPLLVSCAALVYIAGDVLTSVFTLIPPAGEPSRFFFILRELSLMLFMVAGPFFMNQVLEISGTFRKINRIIILAGIAAIVLISTAVAFDPALFIREGSPGLFYRAPDMGPLLITRDILMIVFLIYATVLVLYSELRRNRPYPESRMVKSGLTGLIILCYFVFSYIYSILFTHNPAESTAFLYPHFGLGITIFVVFMTGGILDVLIEYRTRLIKVKSDLKHVVYFDAFLGIPNKTSFRRDLDERIRDIDTGKGPFSLLFLDIDDFQHLNECYGENVGDEVLKSFAGRFMEIFNHAGTFYRIGGDDFAFLLVDTATGDGAKDIAGKIITSLRNPFSVQGVSYLVTASIGILLVPRDGDNPEVILKNAYSVIRSAKKIKNTYEVFTRELLDVSFNKINVVNQLRDSINRDMFTLYYQPIVNTREEPVYAEALLRCMVPESCSIVGGPDIFIPLLEEAGLAKEIDNMVIRKAFHDLELHIKKYFKISINLSTNQLVNPGFSEFLSSFAAQHGIENRQVILEVTESMLMENLSAGRERLKMLKEHGFTIAIDDFGTGFSSLAYLAELPVDIIKIDIVFVQSVPGNAKKEAMARHIVELAHSLNLTVIAEGFETREQFEFFKNLGCDFFQGYLFSHPKPLGELIAEYFGK